MAHHSSLTSWDLSRARGALRPPHGHRHQPRRQHAVRGRYRQQPHPGDSPSMSDYFLVNLGNEQRHGYVVGRRLTESHPAYSPLLDIGFSRQSCPWRDKTPHLHIHSEEYFIVIQGRLDLVVNKQPIPVEAGRLVGIRAGVPHQITSGQAPPPPGKARAARTRPDGLHLAGH